MAVLDRRVFCDCAAGSVRPATPGAGKLRSRERAVFIHFIYTVRFCDRALRFCVTNFAQPLLALVNYAAGSELYSYILLIPFVSAYLLYLRRDQLPKNYVADLPLAIVFLAAGLGVPAFRYWLDFAGRAPAGNLYLVLSTISFLCCLAAGGFFFFGRRWMRAAAFPLAYLIFMVPMPDAMADALETASKYASAEVANLFFHLSGTPFLRAGLIFQLPNITIEVAQECSGIRSSWVLLMTSILAANLFLKTPWRRLALVAFRHPTCHFAKRISDSCDRASLREYRPADDSQPDPPARRSPLFRAFADSIFSSVVVAAQGRRPDPTIGVALSFTDVQSTWLSTVMLLQLADWCGR